MFKNPFREPTHTEYASESLARAKMELLKALENLEYYESVVSFKRKQIARLEGTEYAKLIEVANPSNTAGNSNPNIRNTTTVPDPI